MCEETNKILFLFLEMTKVTKPYIKTKDFKTYVISNEKFLKQYERTYIVQLINAMNFKRSKFNTAKFLENIKMKRKRSHKQEAKWYFKLFAELGAKYSRLKKIVNNVVSVP